MAGLGPHVVLLYYQEYEWDRFFRYDRYLRRVARPVYKWIRKDQSVTGFYVWYRSLVESLRLCGYQVILNDRALARRNPTHPVGLVGYPVLLDNWDLPNPSVLGPALFDHPSIRPGLMQDPRFKSYLTTCDWMDAMFRPVYGDAVVPWYAGIDTDHWFDTRSCEKSYDLLIYDKIRWHRDRLVPELLDPILQQIDARGLRYTMIRYRQHQHEQYRELLTQSRAMVFLCEHETQGLAYQEAMASGLPILAWDQGVWADPQAHLYSPTPIPASSVPYFSADCGERFRGIEDFPAVFERFLGQLDQYDPRAYVQRALRREDSAALYMRYYHAAAASF